MAKAITPDLINKISKTFDLSTLMSEDTQKDLSNIISAFEEQINSFEKKKMSDEEIEEVYQTLTSGWNNFVTTLNSTLYNFNLTEGEATLIYDELARKMHYSLGDDSLLLADKIYNEWLYKLNVKDLKVKAGNYQITCAQAVLLLSLLANVEIQGIGDKFKLMFEVVKKAGAISIAYAPYHQKSEELGAKIQDLFNGISEINDPDAVTSTEQ
jgi:hypothetical protein